MHPLALLLLLPLSAAALERWAGPDGVIHIEGRGAPPAPKIEGPRLHRVGAVPDGDTVHLADGEKLRLIGLNAPEVAHRGRPGEPGGEAAARFLRRLLEGRRVRLEGDVEARDHYGRRLVHLHDERGANLNERLLREGLAYAVPRPPNLRHAERYARAEDEAREALRGLWAHPHYRVRPAGGARECRNRFCRLRGEVVAAKGDRVTLAGGLELFIPTEHRGRFKAAGIVPESLAGRTVTVRGWVGLRHGRLTLTLRHPLQIEKHP